MRTVVIALCGLAACSGDSVGPTVVCSPTKAAQDEDAVTVTCSLADDSNTVRSTPGADAGTDAAIAYLGMPCGNGDAIGPSGKCESYILGFPCASTSVKCTALECFDGYCLAERCMQFGKVGAPCDNFSGVCADDGSCLPL